LEKEPWVRVQKVSIIYQLIDAPKQGVVE
jgi:hypothetical protein